MGRNIVPIAKIGSSGATRPDSTAGQIMYVCGVLFLGREQELQQLERTVSAALEGRGGLHLVVGEPGIGKTRLADEVASLAAARGMVVAWGRAWETGGAPPFFPWLEALEALDSAGLAAPSLDQHRPANTESTRTDSARQRFDIFKRVGDFLRKRSQVGPLLLIFDDLHAADLPTLELLHFVSRNLQARRIAIIGTARDVEGNRGVVGEVLARIRRAANEVALRALGSEDVARLVEAHTGRADAQLSCEVLAKTEGNPLFVAEALRLLDERGSLAPSGVLSVIASRIEGLDPETSSLLDAASVIGRRFEATTLAHATQSPLTEVLKRLSELCTRGVLRAGDDGSYAFTHALVRDAFYERIALHHRRELHRAIAGVVSEEGKGRAALAAHHALAAFPLLDADVVIRASIVAAEVARARLAPEDAVALLDRTAAALEHRVSSESDQIELLLALGWAATEAGSLARGRQVFREASRRAASTGDATLVARAALGQGAQLVFGEVRDELVATLRSALAGLSEGTDLRARLQARLSAALQPSTNPEEPIALARQAIDKAKQLTDPRVRAEIALAAGSALVDFAPPAERIPVSEELVRSAQAIDDPVVELRGLTRLATDWIELGDFARAELAIDAVAELAARLGQPRYLWQTPLLRSMLAMPKGDFDQCDEAIEEASAIGQECLDANAAHVITRHRFWLLLVRGDSAGLRAHLPEMLKVMSRMPEPAQHHALVQAVVQARSGDAAGARQALAGIGDGKRMLAPMMLATIADAALLSDDTARFPELFSKLSPARGRFTAWGPFAFTCGAPYDALLGSLAERLGRHEEARAHFDAAAELARRAGASAAPPPAPAAAEATASLDFSLHIEGKDAIVTCGRRTTRLRAVRGLPMLARLVEQPGRELHALDLATTPGAEDAVVDAGDTGEVLDAKARSEYQQRSSDLRAEIEEADRFADIGRADRARRELDFLLQQLSSAVGLGGRARRLGSAAERARITVQRRVREAIRKIAAHEPELAQHLDWTIRTGTFCAYEPQGRRTARQR